MAAALKLKGRKFHRLKVVKVAGHDDWGRLTWHCVCECGTKKIVAGWELKEGAVKSCGCLRLDNAGQFHLKHGMTGTPEYQTWLSMRARCNNKNNKDYKNYGGRGIKICKRWSCRNGFIHFFKDMGPRPEGKSIDRINVNGNYTPKNCRWATDEEQANNKRNNVPKPVEIGELAVTVVDKSLAADKPPGGW
jgi:hypothetical protein